MKQNAQSQKNSLNQDLNQIQKPKKPTMFYNLFQTPLLYNLIYLLEFIQMSGNLSKSQSHRSESYRTINQTREYKLYDFENNCFLSTEQLFSFLSEAKEKNNYKFIIEQSQVSIELVQKYLNKCQFEDVDFVADVQLDMKKNTKNCYQIDNNNCYQKDKNKDLNDEVIKDKQDFAKIGTFQQICSQANSNCVIIAIPNPQSNNQSNDFNDNQQLSYKIDEAFNKFLDKIIIHQRKESPQKYKQNSQFVFLRSIDPNFKYKAYEIQNQIIQVKNKANHNSAINQKNEQIANFNKSLTSENNDKTQNNQRILNSQNNQKASTNKTDFQGIQSLDNHQTQTQFYLSQQRKAFLKQTFIKILSSKFQQHIKKNSSLSSQNRVQSEQKLNTTFGLSLKNNHNNGNGNGNACSFKEFAPKLHLDQLLYLNQNWKDFIDLNPTANQNL